MLDTTNLSQTFIRFLLLQLGLKQSDLRIKLCLGTARFLQLPSDIGDFSVGLLRSFLPFDSPLLSLNEGLPNGGHRPIEIGKPGLLILEAMLELVILSFQGLCALVVGPQSHHVLVLGHLNLACKKLYLFSSTVHLFPVVLLREKAVALLSDDSGGLLSSNLVASDNSNAEFQLMDL